MGLQIVQERFKRCLPDSGTHDAVDLSSDYLALFDKDFHLVFTWSSDDTTEEDFRGFHKSARADIQQCEEMGYPEPCRVLYIDPDLGPCSFIVSTIENYHGEKILYIVIKEKLVEEKAFVASNK